jgi:hypothetical protein
MTALYVATITFTPRCLNTLRRAIHSHLSLSLSLSLHLTREYSPALEAEFEAYKVVVVGGQDPGFGSLMSRLEAALSVDAYENEAVLKKCSNSSVKRKESKIRRAKRREEEGDGASRPPLTAGNDSVEDVDVNL